MTDDLILLISVNYPGWECEEVEGQVMVQDLLIDARRQVVSHLILNTATIRGQSDDDLWFSCPLLLVGCVT